MKCLYIKSIPFGKNAAGGGITHTIGLIQGFLDADTDITIITSCPFDIDNDKTVCLNVPYKKNSLPFIRDYLFFKAYKKALVQWLKNNDQKYDFVYCRNRGFSDLPLVASKIKKSYMILEVNDIVHKTVWDLVLYPNMKKHSKIVAPLFYFSNFILEHLIKRIEEPVIKSANRLVVVSDQMKKNLLDYRYKAPEMISVIPNGVNPNVFQHSETRQKEYRKKYSIPDDHVVIGFAGTFGNWHGIPELTDVIYSLADTPKTHFLLMGDGLLKKEMQTNLQNFPNIIFTGLVPFPEMPGHLDCCDILIISNSWDPKFNKPFFGSPTKLFEYMAMQKAIVASRLEQISEILEDHYSALLFEPGNTNEMKAKISTLINDSKLREELGKNARQTVISNYTWKGNAIKINRIIQEDLTKQSS